MVNVARHAATLTTRCEMIPDMFEKSCLLTAPAGEEWMDVRRVAHASPAPPSTMRKVPAGVSEES